MPQHRKCVQWDLGGRGVERLGPSGGWQESSGCSRVMPNETDQNERWDCAGNRTWGRLPMVVEAVRVIETGTFAVPIPLQWEWRVRFSPGRAKSLWRYARYFCSLNHHTHLRARIVINT